MKQKYKMKKILFTFITFFINIPFALAQETTKGYTPLAPLPFATNGGSTSLSTYLPGLFKLLIGSGAVLAFLFIFWYGFEYMFSDSLLSKSKARERIQEVLGGLILIILSYAILYNINPATLNMQLTLNKPKVVGNTVLLTDVSVSGGCASCSTLNSLGVNVKPGAGTQVIPELGNKLKTLSGSVSGLQITEAYPPTRSHIDSCHQNGTCVDAVFSQMNNTEKIKEFIENSKKAGLRAEFETSDSKLVAELEKLGLSQKKNGGSILLLSPCQSNTQTNCITGSHFSVYNQ